MVAPLVLRDLTTHFGGLAALDGVDLDLASGSITALVGPNGAGKSTLLRTVAGLDRPTRGTVTVGGTDVTRWPAHAIRRAGVATVPQAPQPLVSMTVREDVAVAATFGSGDGRRRRRPALADADAALDLVGLDHRAGAAVTDLTLHELRVLGVARAIVGRPRVVLLDEPLAGLTEAELTRAVAVLRRVRDEVGAALLWVEHVVGAVVALAERVVVLDGGVVIASGDPRAVMREDRVVTAYLGPSVGDERARGGGSPGPAA